MPMWNPWHGCHKISAGCRHCYVYREDLAFGTEIPTSEIRKTGAFKLPIKRDRKKNLKFLQALNLHFVSLPIFY